MGLWDLEIMRGMILEEAENARNYKLLFLYCNMAE
jgi:hypothetical protein